MESNFRARSGPVAAASREKKGGRREERRGAECRRRGFHRALPLCLELRPHVAVTPPPMSLFASYRFLLLTRGAPAALVATIKARGGLMMPAAMAGNPAAVAALASDAQVIALAEEERWATLDPAVRSSWSGRAVRLAWVIDSVRRGALQNRSQYRIDEPAADSRARAAAVSPSPDALDAAPAARPSPFGPPSIASLLSSGSGSGKRRREQAVNSAASSQLHAADASAPASAPAMVASESSGKKPRIDPVLASALRQHRRTSLEHKLQRFKRATDEPLAVDAAAVVAREEIVIDSTPESMADDASVAGSGFADMSREDQISAAVSSLVASGFTLPVIVHALLVTSGRFGVARHYLLHRSLPSSELAWDPADDGAIGSANDAAILAVIARRGKDSVQRRVDFLRAVSADRNE